MAVHLGRYRSFVGASRREGSENVSTSLVLRSALLLTLAAFLPPALEPGNGAAAGFFPLGGCH